jgi:hypothetical protein
MNIKKSRDEMGALPSRAVESGYIAAHRPRSYQLEMLERSLKGNVIITVRSSRSVYLSQC